MDNFAFDLPADDNSLLQPQANHLLLGHEKTEKLLAKDIAAGRLPHALIIAGPKGIGKATLAFRLARYLLAGKAEEDAGGLFGDAAPSESLEIDAEDRAAKLVAAGSHPNLFYVQPTDIDSIKGTKRANPFIGVSEARITRDFLSHTPSEKGWRVVLIDGA
ncbi:MAG: ATP-binding protein, partial [Alphaproteobacteria bacterium]